MGPYTKYGLVGAGAGLLFYAFGAQKGGPISTPGSSCKWHTLLSKSFVFGNPDLSVHDTGKSVTESSLSPPPAPCNVPLWHCMQTLSSA